MKPFIFLMSILVLAGCSQMSKKGTDEKTSSSIRVDSLNAVFLAGWNNKDSAAIMGTLAPNAIVMNDSLIHTGKEAIAKNWVSGGVQVLSNIRTNPSIQNSSGNLAYDAGTYSLDLTVPGGPVLKEKGNYSLVWTRQTDGQWLLTLLHIEDITRLPDIQ